MIPAVAIQPADRFERQLSVAGGERIFGGPLIHAEPFGHALDPRAVARGEALRAQEVAQPALTLFGLDRGPMMFGLFAESVRERLFDLRNVVRAELLAQQLL